MLDFNKHVSQATHNRNFLDNNDIKNSYKDWYATVAFYSALHFVEALFDYLKLERTSFTAKNGIKISINRDIDNSSDACNFTGKPPHAIRNEILTQHKDKFLSIPKNYEKLYKKSRTARYYCHDILQFKIDNIKDYLDNIKQDFDTIVNEEAQ